jgi:hypothetical protein
MWFRWWEGTGTDPKFGVVAKKSGQPVAVVLAVWALLLENASETQCNAKQRGEISGFDFEAVDSLLGIEEGASGKVFAELAAKGMVAGNKIANWGKRQPKKEDPTNTDRSRKHREKDKTRGNAGQRGETQCNAMQRDETPGNAIQDKSIKDKNIQDQDLKKNPKTLKPTRARENEPHGPTPEEREILGFLRATPGYPFDEGIDLKLVREHRRKVPGLDLPSQARKFRDRYAGRGFAPGEKPRSRLSTWMRLAEEERLKGEMRLAIRDPLEGLPEEDRALLKNRRDGFWRHYPKADGQLQADAMLYEILAPPGTREARWANVKTRLEKFFYESMPRVEAGEAMYLPKAEKWLASYDWDEPVPEGQRWQARDGPGGGAFDLGPGDGGSREAEWAARVLAQIGQAEREGENLGEGGGANA